MCPDTVLTYRCTSVGAGNTVWEGSVFDCRGNSIILRHSQFSSVGISGDCNNGKIIARSVGVDNDCYISQLMITVSGDFNNKSIYCIHDSTMGLKTIGLSTLNVLEG